MSPSIATSICVIGIVALFWLDRDAKIRTSPGLWVPVIWMEISCSRPVSEWLQLGTPIDTSSAVLEGSPVDRAVYSCLLVAGLAILCQRPKMGRLLRANGALIFYYCYALISILWSDYPGTAVKRWPKAVGDLVMVLVVLSDAQPLAAFQRLMKRLYFVLLPLSILFIKYIPSLGMGWNYWTGGAILTGVTTNKNTLGAICLCFGLVAVWRFLSVYQDRGNKGRIRKLTAHGASLLMIIYLFQEINSMTSMSCFLMSIVVLSAAHLRPSRRWPAIIHVLIASMVLVSASVLFLGADPDALKAMGRNPTLTDRTIIWSQMLTQVRDPIFGTGFESFWLGSRLDAIWRLNPILHPNEAHNGYLEVYLNLGWVGIALLGLVLVTGYRNAIKAWRGMDPRGGLLLALFFTGLVYNFTEAAYFKMQAVEWLFILFAIIYAPVSPTQKGRRIKTAPSSVLLPA